MRTTVTLADIQALEVKSKVVEEKVGTGEDAEVIKKVVTTVKFDVERADLKRLGGVLRAMAYDYPVSAIIASDQYSLDEPDDAPKPRKVDQETGEVIEGEGIESVTLSGGGQSVTITKEGAERIEGVIEKVPA